MIALSSEFEDHPKNREVPHHPLNGEVEVLKRVFEEARCKYFIQADDQNYAQFVAKALESAVPFIQRRIGLGVRDYYSLAIGDLGSLTDLDSLAELYEDEEYDESDEGACLEDLLEGKSIVLVSNYPSGMEPPVYEYDVISGNYGPPNAPVCPYTLSNNLIRRGGFANGQYGDTERDLARLVLHDLDEFGMLDGEQFLDPRDMKFVRDILGEYVKR